MGSGALGHIPESNVSHKLWRELIRCFDVYHGCLNTLWQNLHNPYQDKRCTGHKFCRYYTFHLLHLYFFLSDVVSLKCQHDFLLVFKLFFNLKFIGWILFRASMGK
ncbi:hypothetical protein AHAS_Ahas13G0250400 [Arachis hypogaea]